MFLAWRTAMLMMMIKLNDPDLTSAFTRTTNNLPLGRTTRFSPLEKRTMLTARQSFAFAPKRHAVARNDGDDDGLSHNQIPVVVQQGDGDIKNGIEPTDCFDKESNSHDDDDDDTYQLQDDAPMTSEMEKAWRYAKKPLLSIGSKGATLSHGNSLRQLLEAHVVVKVKVNTRKFDGSLRSAFEHLRQLAEESGATPGMELVQARNAEKIILLGLPGTVEQIERGTFPPVPPPPYERPYVRESKMGESSSSSTSSSS
jgi:RNA-binding protein YhbY